MPRAPRIEARDRAIDAAIAAGRGALLAYARQTVRDWALDAYAAAGYRPTWVGELNWGLSAGRAEDRVSAALAVEDAVIAVVAEDVITEDDIAELTAPHDVLARAATGGPPSDSLSHALRSRPGRLTALVYLVFAVAGFGIMMSQVIGPAGLVAAAAVLVGIVSAFRVRAARAAERR